MFAGFLFITIIFNYFFMPGLFKRILFPGKHVRALSLTPFLLSMLLLTGNQGTTQAHQAVTGTLGPDPAIFSYANAQPQEIRPDTRKESDEVAQVGLTAFSPVGFWRGTFQIYGNQQIPFNFEVTQNGRVYLLNGDERFESGVARIAGDSLFIPLDPFDNEFAFKVAPTSLEGVLRKQDKSGVPVAVKAEKGSTVRFTGTAAPAAQDISGTYDISFGRNGNGDPEKAVGLFKQEGRKLTATFLRTTGDSRFLEGIVEGNNFYLSSFIGSSPVYYHGSFTEEGQLAGEVSGVRGGQSFTGLHNEEAALPDPYRLTYLKDGYTSLDFSLPGTDGKRRSPKDAKYKNKVLIVTITGSWCPNCMDEATFLAPWYKKNRSRGVEIISIHYERQTDTAYTNRVINRFRKRFDIQYDQVLGGRANKQEVAASLPALNAFLSFPTTILIDKKGNVARIHTGYSGPATGKYNAEFVKEFNEDVDRLLKE